MRLFTKNIELLVFLLLVCMMSNLRAQVFNSKEVLYENTGVLQGWYTESVYTAIDNYNGAYFFILLDNNRKPFVGKTKDGITTLEPLTKEFPNYQARDDGHHEFSLGIDKAGYIHIVGDMHNHPQGANSHLPSALQSTNILYWKSSSPGDITDFEFVGSTDETIPGVGWGYAKFDIDRNGELYFSARTVAREQFYQKDINGAGRGFGIYKYNVSTERWTALGQLADVYDATYPVVIWEPSSQKPSDQIESYQQYKGGITFDKNNRMHVTTALNAQFGPHPGNTVVYAYSDDEGQTFHKANGIQISIPIRTSGASPCDVVDFDQGGWIDQPDVVVAFQEKPVIQYHYNGQAYYKYWDGSTWSSRINSPVNERRNRVLFNEHTQELLFINVWNGAIYAKQSITSPSVFYDAGETFRYFNEREFAQKNILTGVSWKSNTGKFQVIQLVGNSSGVLDCNGELGGEAFVDDCNQCVGGNTNLVSCNRSPFNGSPLNIPGLIQAEEYDSGANTITYYDLTLGNEGNVFREGDQDLEECEDLTDLEPGFNIGWIQEGEWYEYTVSVEETNDYLFEFRTATEAVNVNGFHVDFDGQTVINTFPIPQTSGWQQYTSVLIDNVPLEVGQHVIRITADGSSFNFNSVDITLSNMITGISKNIKDAYSVYPNPTNGVFHLPSSATWQLFSIDGIKLSMGANAMVNLEELGLQKGTYFIIQNNKVERIIYK